LKDYYVALFISVEFAQDIILIECPLILIRRNLHFRILAVLSKSRRSLEFRIFLGYLILKPLSFLFLLEFLGGLFSFLLCSLFLIIGSLGAG